MIEKIKKICLMAPKVESCGLFIMESKGDRILYYPCANVHQTPETDFEISTEDFIVAEKLGKIIGIYHSHTENCLDKPSQFDYYYSDLTGYFNIVYIISKDEVFIVDPCKVISENIKAQIGI
jgi:proteasome lid subunit RPN8/RPN11